MELNSDGSHVTNRPPIRIKHVFVPIFSTNQIMQSVAMLPSKLAASIDIDELEKDLKTSTETGLTSSEAQKRIEHFGKNELCKKEDDPLWKKYFEQFKQPLVLMLLVSAGISVVIGQWDDAISITLAVVIVCTVAFIQEYRSEQALDALTQLVKHKCKVIRDGTLQETESSELVPGDLVTFTVGDRIPADIRIFKAIDLTISEAELTGESVAVEKVAEKLGNQTLDSKVLLFILEMEKELLFRPVTQQKLVLLQKSWMKWKTRRHPFKRVWTIWVKSFHGCPCLLLQ
jgi:magnesium-transporting ATPase (P-type)